MIQSKFAQQLTISQFDFFGIKQNITFKVGSSIKLPKSGNNRASTDRCEYD